MNSCDLLDDYLAHDLGEDRESVFVAHLAECRECRDAVSAHQRLAGLLIEACERFEPVPRIRYRRSSFGVRRVAAMVAAIAAFVVGLWWFADPAHQPEAIEQRIAKADPPPAILDQPRVSVTFPKDAHVTAVQIPTDAPNVTFYWIFPDRTSRSNSERNAQ